MRSNLSDEIGAKADRKIKARERSGDLSFGLGTIGVVGWSVALPTLLGAGLGSWLDARQVGGHNWTLALLTAGLCLGCFNAWHWVSKQNEEINK